MQHFVNQGWLDRAAGEVFQSERSRHYFLAAMTLATCAVVGLTMATIWLGLVLGVEETRRALKAQLAMFSDIHARWARLALGAARAAAYATAPAMAWFSRSDLGQGLAVLMLVALALRTLLLTRRNPAQAAFAASPYLLVGLAFLADGATSGEMAGALACVVLLGFVFAAALHMAQSRRHAQREDAEIVRQLNAALESGDAAAWEADFVERTLLGGDALARLFGRPVSYECMIERACFAPPADRPLVQAAFAPQRGAFRRLAIEHEAHDGDGAVLRVRHEGVVRTTPDGRPLRLCMVTRRVKAQTQSMGVPANLEALARQTAEVQQNVLKGLANELSSTALVAPPITTAGLEDLMAMLAQQAEAVSDGAAALARERHAAESPNLAKSQFLASMSHELRTPLNAIIGYSEILQEDAVDNGDDATVQDLNRILAAARHLLSLINEILDLSKIEAGRMDVSAAPFDPLNLLREVIDTVQPLADANGNVITLEGDEDALAESDAMKVRQCVLNLLSNACKFTKNGRIEVRYARRIEHGVAQMFFCVRDTGIGMSQEHMSRLFQPFVQADPTITQRYGGTGLGLTITRRLAQLLGGDVDVDSTLGQGATFTVHMPLNFADASAALGAAAAVDIVQGPADAPLVVVIEDEPAARELAARALTRAGFAVQGVGGGEAGLALARAKAPALVLLDIYLPDRSGWRVLQALKHEPKTRDIPVVVLSMNEDRAHAMALGAAEHIVKPADRDMLAATVMRLARKRPSLETAASPAQQHKQAS